MQCSGKTRGLSFLSLVTYVSSLCWWELDLLQSLFHNFLNVVGTFAFILRKAS